MRIAGRSVTLCAIVQYAWISNACASPCLLAIIYVPTLDGHVQVPAALKTIRVQPCSAGSLTSQMGTICSACQNSTFSLDPANTSCDACPSGAQCYGSDVFIPLLQHYHSSPNSTNIVSCPNPGACGGSRFDLRDCKRVSADYMTTQSVFGIYDCSCACCLL